jgi:ABC-type dipeptide/oligopeptide/nickel transport system permease component/ABC-type transport system substrate-binding protein
MSILKQIKLNAGKFISVIFVALGMILIAFLFAWLTKTDLTKSTTNHTKKELLKAERLRANSFDPRHPLRIQVDVDYSKKSASWFPKGESPILNQLVNEKKLPPVEDRVGPEPCVMKGVNNIGKYGGTWMRLNGLQIGHRMSYTSLVRFSPQGFPIVPHLAKSWEVTNNYCDWTFFLRKGVKWSDGVPFTSADILYRWKNEMNCHEVCGTTLPDYMTVSGESCKVICYSNDPYKITFSFPKPKGNFLALIATGRGANLVNSPAHFLRKYHPVLGDQQLISNVMIAAKLPSALAAYTYVKGENNPYHPRLWPWIVRGYKANPPLTAVRNPYYWAVDTKGNQLPYIDQLMSESVSQDMVPLRAAAGGVSFQARYIGYENYTYLMDQQKDGNYHLYHWYAGDRSAFAVQFNLNRHTDPKHPSWRKKRELMQNKFFRQAMSLAINRQAIIKTIYNNLAEPAQVAPGRTSPFFYERALKAFTEFDPSRAGKLLDKIGLNKRDSEGFRTFKDCSRMTFYLDYTRGLISRQPVQFIIDDWKNIGVRVIPRERQRSLWDVERRGLMHDMNVWIGNCEDYPIIEPRYFAPVQNCTFAQANAKWFIKGGLWNSPAAKGKGCEALTSDNPLYKALKAYLHACETADLDEQVKNFRPALDIAAENVWTIGICTPPPVLCVVKNYMRNVPKTAISSWEFQTPGNAGIETFYMNKSNNSPGAVNKIKNEIAEPKGRPGDLVNGKPAAIAEAALKIKNNPGQSNLSKTGHLVSVIIKYLIWAAIGLALFLAAFRHPYIARRLLIMIPTLTIISIIVFIVIQLPPGDFLTSRIIQLSESGDSVSQQQIKEIEEQFYLNEPMPLRYLRWMGFTWFISFDAKDKGLLQGYLGRSMEYGMEVNEIIGDRLLLTILISLGTIIFTWIVAVPIGIYSAVRQYSIGDYILTFLGFVGMCIPSFLLALLMMYFSFKFFGIHISGLLSPEFAMQPEWNWPKIKDLLQHIWLPVVVLGMGGTAGMIRVMRANLLDELKKPYVVTARAKGVRPVKLLLKYPVRLALNPFISGIGGIFPQLISGGAIVAVVLSLPTVGPLMLNALMTEDMYLAGSMLMVLSLLGVVGTLISDLLLLVLDPRIRMDGGGR